MHVHALFVNRTDVDTNQWALFISLHYEPTGPCSSAPAHLCTIAICITLKSSQLLSKCTCLPWKPCLILTLGNCQQCALVLISDRTCINASTPECSRSKHNTQNWLRVRTNGQTLASSVAKMYVCPFKPNTHPVRKETSILLNSGLAVFQCAKCSAWHCLREHNRELKVCRNRKSGMSREETKAYRPQWLCKSCSRASGGQSKDGTQIYTWGHR